MSDTGRATPSPGTSPTDPIRRRLLQASAATAAGLPFAGQAAAHAPAEGADGGGAPGDGRLPVTLTVNGQRHDLRLDPRTTLVDALRETVGLTGTKIGCNHGQCGACTVLVDGVRKNSCLLLAVMAEGREVTTVEGLASPQEPLHPMQAAFVEHDAFQCGYCTPGQILSAIACLEEGHAGSEWEIREYMSGNLCRCGAYPNIVRAIEAVRDGEVG